MQMESLAGPEAVLQTSPFQQERWGMRKTADVFFSDMIKLR